MVRLRAFDKDTGSNLMFIREISITDKPRLARQAGNTTRKDSKYDPPILRKPGPQYGHRIRQRMHENNHLGISDRDIRNHP